MADETDFSSRASVATPTTDPSSYTEPPPSLYYQNRWEEALDICRHYLKPIDLDDVAKWHTCEDLLKDLTQRDAIKSDQTIPLLLRRISPALIPLKRLVDILAIAMRGDYNIVTALVWGIVQLLIEACLKSTDILAKMVEMFEEVGHRLHVLELYVPEGITLGRDPKIESAIVEVLLDIIKFWAKTVSVLSRDTVGLSQHRALLDTRAERHTECGLQALWNTSVTADLKITSDRIQRNTDRIREIAYALMYRKAFLSQQRPSAVEILQSLEVLQIRDRIESFPNGTTKQPSSTRSCYHHIPFPENNRFFKRENISDQMRTELTHNAADMRTRSMILWGIGGVGKTQLALAYAYERQRQGLKFILWVHSENRDVLLQSCTDICIGLGLDGVVIAGQNQGNHAILVKWLRETPVEFLLIFDNVDDFSVVGDTMVDSKRGSILITSRQELVSLLPINVMIHVPFMTTSEGARFLLDMSNQSGRPAAVTKSAEELTKILGGLPLAIAIMAMQARKRGMNLSRFLTFYKENEVRLHGPDKKISLEPFYHFDLSTAYKLSFQSLDENTKALLRIICLLSPDEIHLSLFQPGDAASVPTTISFCSNSWMLEECLSNLISASLIHRDSDNDTISIHRVIQLEFRNTLDDNARREHIRLASSLLFDAFPKQINGRSLRNEWPRCALFIQHVLSLITHFDSFGLAATEPGEFRSFVEALSNAAWYLMESGSWDRCEDILETAFRACDEKGSILYAHLLNTAGYLRDKRNRSKEALEYYKESRIIRESLLGPEHEEMANTYNNMGLALESCCRYQEALDCFEKAVRIDMTKPKDERDKILHIRYLNLGSVYTHLGERQKAVEYIEMGRQHAIQTFGADTYYESIADYQLSEIDYRCNNFTEAKRKLEKALVIQRKQNSLHPTTGASLFKLACVELKAGELGQAEVHLDEALLIAQYNVAQKGDQGDVARVQRRLAEVYDRIGRQDDSRALFEMAEAVRKQILGQDWERYDDSEKTYNLLVSCYYR